MSLWVNTGSHGEKVRFQVIIIIITCFYYHKMQRVIPNIGDGSNIMDGHSQDDVFSIPPYKLYVVCRQAHHCILLWCQLACQLLGLLRITEAHSEANSPCIHKNYKYHDSFNPHWYSPSQSQWAAAFLCDLRGLNILVLMSADPGTGQYKTCTYTGIFS